MLHGVPLNPSCHFKVYAMKSMLKEHMILKNQVTHVKAERDVMAEADDPWIVKLMYSFQVQRSTVQQHCSTTCIWIYQVTHPSYVTKAARRLKVTAVAEYIPYDTNDRG